MPEGDTIHKLANYLGPRLEDQRILRAGGARADVARRLNGRHIEGVSARGKHLFIELDNATALRSHLGMHGSWHRYAHDEEWQRPQSQASIVLRIAEDDYVCFNAKEVEVVRLSSVRNRVVNERLGPDLIGDEVDTGALVRRAREFLEPDALLIDVLLDQRVASGIGNVYKSEVLFIERLPPDTMLGEVSDDELASCFVLASHLLRRNLGGGMRVTRFENDSAGSVWVYGRTGQPCHECDTPIRSRRMGRNHRGTFWCPACQAPKVND